MKIVGLLVFQSVCSLMAQSLVRPDFNQAPVLALPYSPLDVAIGDLNKDGHLDLVLGGYSNDVLILLNRGDGTFDSPLRHPTGGTTDRVAMVDLDRDGNLDVVTITGNSVVILLGNGTGRFGPPAGYSCDKDSRYLVIGDFNGDGAPDIVAGAFSTTSLPVLFNDGVGRFDGRTNVNLGTPVSRVTVGDFNADGFLDMVAAHYDEGTLDIVLGNGDGTFRTPIGLNVGPYPSLIAVADFNEDGRMDLAVFHRGVMSVWGGNGNGGFARVGETAIIFYFGHREVEATDLNGDGHADLVWASGFYNTINILLGNGQGGFSANNYIAGMSVTGVAVGDLNGDGRPDIAAPSDLGSTLSLLFNKGDGNFAAPRVYEDLGTTLVDLNGDGKLDAMGASSRTNRVSVRLGNGDGTFSEARNFPIDYAANAEAAGDLNNDGHVDLVAALFTNRVSVLLGAGDGTFVSAPSQVLNGEPGAVGLGDFNGDGRLDLAISAYFTNAAMLIGNGDGTFAPELQIEGSGLGRGDALGVGDFNNDGKLDLVVDFDIFLGRGDGTFSLMGSLPSLPWLRWMSVADFNADGNLDLVDVSSRGLVVIYGGDGQGGFAELSRLTLSLAAYPRVGDFNLDGKLDLAVFLAYDGRVFLGNGDGTFVPGGDYFQLGAVGDVNGDGLPDMVGGMVLLNQTFTKLAITRTPSGMELGWPSFTAGLMLENTDNLLAPNWQGVRSRVSVQDNRYVVTNGVTRASEFFRLRRQ